VSLLAAVLCLALPDRELKGAGPAAGGRPSLDEESDEDAAAEMEARAATMI
jgi:hypothetical protein